MAALILGPVQRAAIAIAMAHAEAHVVTAQELHRTLANPDLAVGNDPAFVVEIPFGFRCVYSLEEQPGPGLCRHLSVSCTRGGRPGVQACALILEAFGFVEVLSPTICAWVEPVDAHHEAMNFLQPVNQERSTKNQEQGAAL